MQPTFRDRRLALAALRECAAHHAGKAGVALANSHRIRVRHWRAWRRLRHGHRGIYDDLGGQTRVACTALVVRLYLLAGLPYHGECLHQQFRLLRPAALSAQLPLVFSGSISLWRVRSGNRDQLSVVVWHFAGRGICETGIAALGAAGHAGIRRFQSFVHADDLCLGRALAGETPHPRAHGHPVYLADVELSDDRTARGTFPEEILAAGRAAVRRYSCSSAAHPSSRSCCRCHCASSLSTSDDELQLIRSAVRLCTGRWLLLACAAAVAVSR